MLPINAQLALPVYIESIYFFSAGNCLPLPVITDDKPIVIGQALPVQHVQQLQTIPTYTNTHNSSLVAVPTSIMTTVTTPSNVIQQPIRIQSGGFMQNNTAVNQNISEYFIPNNFSRGNQTMLPSGGTLFVAEDGTLQISSNVPVATQNSMVINTKPDASSQATLTAKTVGTVQQQPQQPVIIIAPQNNQNTVSTVLDNVSEKTTQPAQIVYEVRQPVSTTTPKVVPQTSYTIVNGNEVLGNQSVSSNGIQPQPMKSVTAQPIASTTVSSLHATECLPNQGKKLGTASQNLFIIKENWRKCHSGSGKRISSFGLKKFIEALTSSEGH